MTTTRAAVLDVDGTLLDTDYLHVHAWGCALRELDLPVDAWRVHRAIGMGSAQLLETLLPDADDEVRAKVKSLHTGHYAGLAPLLRPFDGAEELVRALAGRGAAVVLATSASPEEVERMGRALPVAREVPLVGGADVEHAKPEPDLVHRALAEVGADARDAVMVGDSLWDVRAAASAGVRCVGLLTGGVSEAELRDAGAVAVYAGPRDLLDRLADSPLAEVAPGNGAPGAS